MPTTSSELRQIALEAFAASGYLGTSIQQIADRAGVSKASVLYHYSSKEVLLDAALSPAIDRLEVVLGGLGRIQGSPEARIAFLEEFVDFLLEHRLGIYIFINQASTLVDIPIIERATALIGSLAAYFEANAGSAEERMRFGVALGGAAYMLASAQLFTPQEFVPDAEMRAALVRILGELLSGVAAA